MRAFGPAADVLTAAALLRVVGLHGQGQTAEGTPFRIEMRVDVRGNLYTTSGGGPGQNRIWSPDGRPLGALHLLQPAGEPRPRVCATNVAFGDADDRGLYITACAHLFRIRTQIAGVRPGQAPPR